MTSSLLPIDLVTIDDLRNIEQAFAAAHPKILLMQRAGLAVAKQAIAALKKSKTKNILILAGPGNNGGDAWVAAASLQAKCHVIVLALGEQQQQNAAAQVAYQTFIKSNGEIIKSWPKGQLFDLVIDGLFGIGISRPPTGAFADVIHRCNQQRRLGEFLVLAIDIPSGLNGNSGVAFAPAIEADQTITFIAAKPGLYTADGPDHAGTVTIDSLGVDNTNPSGACTLLTVDQVRPLMPNRRSNSHKGTYGNVGIIGGAEGMTGAAVLAARAALHMGAGKVFLGLFDKDRPALDILHPEMMVRDAKLLCKDESMTAFAVGMGMGEMGTASLLGMLILDRPMVIDADAINTISINPSIRAAFQTKKAESGLPCLPFIFTPHPGEAAQLLGIKTSDIQSDRIAAAGNIARQFASVVVLKGAGTIIAHPDGRMVINTSGNPGMATGGMGDALAGMLAAFLAIGLDVWDAARLGVYLHGAAADAALEHGMGPHGLTASDVIFEARSLLNSGLVHDHDH